MNANVKLSVVHKYTFAGSVSCLVRKSSFFEFREVATEKKLHHYGGVKNGKCFMVSKALSKKPQTRFFETYSTMKVKHYSRTA